MYQSETCCEFSALCTTPCHSFTSPHRQIGRRPIASRIAACATSKPATATSHRTFAAGRSARLNGAFASTTRASPFYDLGEAASTSADTPGTMAIERPWDGCRAINAEMRLAVAASAAR